MLLQLSKLLFIVICVTRIAGLDFKYHKYDELTSILKNLTKSYTKVSLKLDSIGQTFQGRKLWIVEITSKNNESFVGIPSVKLIGNIHGNEAVGREVLLHFLKYLGDNYGVDEEITWLLNNTKIYILPSMNPDGFEISNEGTCSGEHGRLNAKKYDLNRNFPTIFNTNRCPEQLETKAVEDWMKKIPFILSASLHGGALVANYPFDSVKEESFIGRCCKGKTGYQINKLIYTKWEKLVRELAQVKDRQEQQKLREDYIESLPKNPPSLSPDDDVFIHLARTYANKHPTMHQGGGCSPSDSFSDGITNGAAWYSFQGGMQDFNYVMHGCMELTLEISCCKYPTASKLPQFWEENRDALVELVKQAHQGVSGKIVDNSTGRPINGADLKVIGRDMNFTTSSGGEFWRLLLPGNYTLQVNAKGYHQQTVIFSVVDYGNRQPKLTKLEIQLINDTYPITILTTISSTSADDFQEDIFTEDDEKIFVNDLDNNIREQVKQNGSIQEIQSSCSSPNNFPCRHVLLYFYCFILIFIY